jgi:hypothetical protein
MEENEIDIIFIPFIWPETFSYTTEEAIKMPPGLLKLSQSLVFIFTFVF